MILNNENIKLSRNRKRRIDQKIRMNSDMKLLLNKIKTGKKWRNLVKVKQLEILLVKIKYANNHNKLNIALKELNKNQVIKKNIHEIKNKKSYKVILVNSKWSVI